MQAKKTKNRNCLTPKSHQGLHVLGQRIFPVGNTIC